MMLPVDKTAAGGCEHDRCGGWGWRCAPVEAGTRGAAQATRVVTGSGGTGGSGPLVELGVWPRLTAQILRARLETAGVDVLARWSGSPEGSVAALAVPSDQAEFARAVVVELDVDDEVPDTSPVAYVNRIEEHLAALGELLEELRSRLADGEDRGRDSGERSDG